MTTRSEIRAVAIQYGWREVGNEQDPEFLDLTRQPEPDAPLGGPRLRVEVRLRDDNRVAECHVGVGRPNKTLTGGAKAIKRHLRWNGHKG